MKSNHLPNRLFLIVTDVALIALCSCARFSTQQTQVDSVDDAGRPVKTTTTRAYSTTFFDSKSGLTAFKATQSDKTQSASVGALTQEASGSNVVALVDVAVQAAVTAAVKSAVPVPTPPR